MADIADIEIWKPIQAGTHEVSSHGRIRRSARGRGTHIGRVLQPQPNSRGYLRITIGHNESRPFVHALVAEAFIGPRPDGTVIAHRDGNHTNNRPENLRYCTNLENEADKIAHGTKASGERNGLAKLSEDRVAEIRRDYVAGSWTHGVKPMARKHGVTPSTIRKLVKGLTWRGDI